MKKEHIGIGVVVIAIVAGGIFLITKVNQSSDFTKSSSNAKNLTSDQNDQEVQGGLVASFPDFPQYPEAYIVNSRSAQDAQGDHYDLRLESNKPVSDIINWYAAEVEKNGWVLQLEDTESEYDQSLLFTKGKVKVGLEVEQETPDETEISISATVIH